MELSFGIRRRKVTCKACGSDSHSMCQPERPWGGTIRLYRPSLEDWYKTNRRLARMWYRRKVSTLSHPVKAIRRPAVMQRSVSIHGQGHDGWVGLKDFDSCNRCWIIANDEISTAFACKVLLCKIFHLPVKSIQVS